jgi:hypothetical protein
MNPKPNCTPSVSQIMKRNLKYTFVIAASGLRTKARRATLLVVLLSAAPLWAAAPINPAVRIYSVNRRVSDFPTNEDLSTPEAAYATIQRGVDGGGPRGLSPPERARTGGKDVFPTEEAGAGARRCQVARRRSARSQCLSADHGGVGSSK